MAFVLAATISDIGLPNGLTSIKRIYCILLILITKTMESSFFQDWDFQTNHVYGRTNKTNIEIMPCFFNF